MPDNFRWITRKYTIEFLTPAFLGGADQSGQWRTPPFKALLRQWWRVAWAAERKFQANVGEMRQREGRLFGNAWLEKQVNGRKETEALRSLFRLRLSSWAGGGRKSWQGLEGQAIRHPEVEQPVGAHLYLGYGPLIYDRQSRQTALKAPPCIDAGSSAELQLALPEPEAKAMEAVLALLHLYGAAGGRSRNGWGSFRLVPADGQRLKAAVPLRDWRQALELDWPHCIGKDEKGPLIWRTRRAYADWKELMRHLAELKIGFRTQFRFPLNVRVHAHPENRHWLAYPVTNHGVAGWGNQARLPNQLRFKVRRANDGNQLVGIVYHMPCRPPDSFSPDMAVVQRVWESVHDFLDNAQLLQRSQE
ncbi:MAG: hypothetical protein KatS3mg005_0225 [Bryobacteraceae bacterium]|nr:MAG: hypothetical protein KatS3mg005_0225 [Bryobacteraceae bacterium]